jgi:hypothetical protein
VTHLLPSNKQEQIPELLTERVCKHISPDVFFVILDRPTSLVFMFIYYRQKPYYCKVNHITDEPTITHKHETFQFSSVSCLFPAATLISTTNRHDNKDNSRFKQFLKKQKNRTVSETRSQVFLAGMKALGGEGRGKNTAERQHKRPIRFQCVGVWI